MASDNEACVNDPNFAVICSFFNKFGKICGVQLPKVKDLQAMLEQSQEGMYLHLIIPVIISNVFIILF